MWGSPALGKLTPGEPCGRHWVSWDLELGSLYGLMRGAQALWEYRGYMQGGLSWQWESVSWWMGPGVWEILAVRGGA